MKVGGKRGRIEQPHLVPDRRVDVRHAVLERQRVQEHQRVAQGRKEIVRRLLECGLHRAQLAEKAIEHGVERADALRRAQRTDPGEDLIARQRLGAAEKFRHDAVEPAPDARIRFGGARAVERVDAAAQRGVQRVVCVSERRERARVTCAAIASNFVSVSVAVP